MSPRLPPYTGYYRIPRASVPKQAEVKGGTGANLAKRSCFVTSMESRNVSCPSFVPGHGTVDAVLGQGKLSSLSVDLETRAFLHCLLLRLSV